MPYVLDPHSIKQGDSVSQAVKSAAYDYEYPHELDLKPGSELHGKLVKEVLLRARESHRYMSRRYDEWKEIDKTLRAYVYAPDNVLKRQKNRTESEDKFQKIVMPVSYANLETLLTYMAAAFLQDPIFKYEGVGPEDVYGAMLLEKKIASDSVRFKHGLALHTHWRDAFAYGIGVISPVWTKKVGYKTVARESGFLNWLGNLFIPTGKRRDRDWGTLYEGNRLENIDPYRYLPDPNVSAHSVQDGEYVGWLDRESYNSLLTRERDEEGQFFNCKYVRHTSGKSQFVESSQQRPHSDKEARVSSNTPVDVIWMYVDLIPKEWKLGDSEYPEKWLIALAADQVIITAQPVGLDHNMYPVAVAAPDYDGYSVAPASKLGIISDLQEIVNFMYSSHVMNVRKSINDMLVVDPSIINIYDVEEPGAGKVIRMRRSLWGRGNIDQAIKQLAIQDITQNNVADSEYLMGFIQRLMGTTDIASGVISNRGPRISATMANTARTSVLSRLEKTARIIDMQSHQDLGYMMASHTQQLMEEETFAKAVGEWANRLAQDFGIQPQRGRIGITPLDLIVEYDVVSHTGSVPGSEDPQLWSQIMQAAGAIPQVAAMTNWPNLFKHIARQMGAKNVDEFIMSSPPQVVPDEQVLRDVEAGNAAPLPEISGDGSPY